MIPKARSNMLVASRAGGMMLGAPKAAAVLLLLLLLPADLAMLASAKPSPDAIKFNITIPADAQVTPEPDAYVCTTLPLPSTPMKLVGISPLARQEVVHHILLFGCSVPHMVPKGGAQPVWDCKRAPTCGSFEETILYGWGRNAPELQLPDGVGFSVGKGSSVRYIVMQVHYLQPKPAGDTSGVALTLQPTPVPFAAGMLSYASWFTIPPGKKGHLVPNSCCYAGFQPLTTFAVRVHTHTLGRSVEMVRAAAGGGGGAARNETIAKGDPLAPQGFNPVAPRVIHPGDRLTVTCTFDSTGVDHEVSAGPTHDHEMCNMYLMAFSKIPHIEMCSDGSGVVSDTQPGSLPAPPLAKLAPAPAGGWAPPKPGDKSGAGAIGDVTSVAIAPSGNLWALHRGGRVWDAATFTADHRLAGDPAPIDRDVVVEMDPDSGKVLRRWGAGVFYMPHMLTVDRDGNVWVTDVGRHQALKFSPDGKLLLEVGAKLTPGSDAKHFCKPTQVAPLRDGSFVVSDGYCNARAVKFDAAGAYVGSYSLGPERAEGGGGSFGPQIAVAHSALADECGRRLYLADREGARVLTFDLDTRKLTGTLDLSTFGRVWALRGAPYGGALALAWDKGRDAALVEVSRDPPAGAGAAGLRHWPLPDTAKAWPHDFALGAAPLELSGAGDRLFAVYAAPLCQDKCGPVRKYVLHPHAPRGGDGGDGASAAVPAAVPAAAASGKPVLAHFGGHGGHGAAAAGSRDGDGKHAGDGGDAHEEDDKEEHHDDSDDDDDDHDDDDKDKHAEEEEDKSKEEEERHREEEEEEEEELEDDEEAEEAAAAAATAAAAAAATAAAAKKGLSDAAAGAGAGSTEVHETLRMTGRRATGGGGGGGGSAFAIGITAVALAALVGSAAYAVVAARRNSGGALAQRRRRADDAAAAFGGSSELAKLAPRHHTQHNGANGAADGDAHEIVFGRHGGGGADGDGDDADEDLERLEREVLLRNGHGAAPSARV